MTTYGDIETAAEKLQASYPALLISVINLEIPQQYLLHYEDYRGAVLAWQRINSCCLNNDQTCACADLDKIWRRCHDYAPSTPLLPKPYDAKAMVQGLQPFKEYIQGLIDFYGLVQPNLSLLSSSSQTVFTQLYTTSQSKLGNQTLLQFCNSFLDDYKIPTSCPKISYLNNLQWKYGKVFADFSSTNCLYTPTQFINSLKPASTSPLITSTGNGPTAPQYLIDSAETVGSAAQTLSASWNNSLMNNLDLLTLSSNQQDNILNPKPQNTCEYFHAMQPFIHFIQTSFKSFYTIASENLSQLPPPAQSYFIETFNKDHGNGYRLADLIFILQSQHAPSRPSDDELHRWLPIVASFYPFGGTDFQMNLIKASRQFRSPPSQEELS